MCLLVVREWLRLDLMVVHGRIGAGVSLINAVRQRVKEQIFVLRVTVVVFLKKAVAVPGMNLILVNAGQVMARASRLVDPRIVSAGYLQMLIVEAEREGEAERGGLEEAEVVAVRGRDAIPVVPLTFGAAIRMVLMVLAGETARGAGLSIMVAVEVGVVEVEPVLTHAFKKPEMVRFAGWDAKTTMLVSPLAPDPVINILAV